MRSKNSVQTYVNSIVSLLCEDVIIEVPDILESAIMDCNLEL